MLAGYNTNISYKDKIFHIQTEDTGKNSPVIITLLFFKGAIIASKKTSYAHIIEDADCEEKIRNMMKEQHKDMIKGLLAGKYTDEQHPAGEFSEKTENQPEESIENENQKIKSLDDVLLNYILNRANR
ncbi:MAG: hypothetical protein IBX72_06385 [Nitrospirae bacterium]|jgi:hypothetical protein|nr:hypothetical protein [Nitrospirota bacterium]